MNVRDLVSPDGSRISKQVFHDPAVYERELSQIFRRCWLYVAHTSQLRSPGDFVTTTMGEEPVIVVRDDDGAIHVLVNSCTHRGTKLCRSHRGTAESFTCPYHGWRFGVDGALRGVPHLSAYGGDFDKRSWGLHHAAKVEECCGLVFATFDPDAPSLPSYLGADFVGYLETVFDRSDAGVRLLDGTHRWRLECNWKVPVENHAPDMIHVDPSHRSAFASFGVDEFTLPGAEQIATEQGHLFAARYLPLDSTVDDRLPGNAMAGMPHAGPHLRAQQPTAEARLGPIRSRLSPIAATVFPNLSVVPTNFTLRVSHPRGPGVTEMWSWCFVPADAPDEVAREVLTVYETMLGPAGLLEAEDGENWISMTTGARTTKIDRRPYNVSMGLGKEYAHPDLPGSFGTVWSEHNQRALYRTWRRWMGGDER